jgi:hypothetical protein
MKNITNSNSLDLANYISKPSNLVMMAIVLSFIGGTFIVGILILAYVKIIKNMD